MVTLVFDEMALLLSLIAVGIAIRKWRVVRDRHLVFTVIRNALKERKALWTGILVAVLYLAVYMILGGQGGRVHLLFGRVIWNATPGDMAAGVLLALLVMLAMALFIFGVHVMGAKGSGRQGGIGITGSMLALLAAFCP